MTYLRRIGLRELARSNRFGTAPGAPRGCRLRICWGWSGRRRSYGRTRRWTHAEHAGHPRRINASIPGRKHSALLARQVGRSRASSPARRLWRNTVASRKRFDHPSAAGNASICISSRPGQVDSPLSAPQRWVSFIAVGGRRRCGRACLSRLNRAAYDNTLLSLKRHRHCPASHRTVPPVQFTVSNERQ